MGESDVILIREDIREVKKAVGELTATMADLRVQVAGSYVAKEDFLKSQELSEARIVKLYDRIDTHEREDKADRWRMAGLVAALAGVIVSIGQWVIGLVRGGNS